MLGHGAICEGPPSALEDTATVTQELTVRFATQSFVTRSTDSPAHEFIEGRVSRGLELGRQITLPGGQPFGALFESGTGPNFGEIELLNLDGALDPMVHNYFADGRPIRLKIGATEINQFGREKVKPYSTFALVYTAIAGEWRFEHDHVRLVVRNQADRIKDRLQRLAYAGTGGKQGTAEMLGRTMPTAFGRCLNITAQLVDPNVFTYQLHAGKIDSITSVYDAGVVVPFDSNHATYQALVAATIPAGHYASCLLEGFIRLGTAPIGDITADIRGHRTSAAQGDEYFDKHGGVMKRILLDYSDLTSADIDVLSFDVLDIIQPESMGLFLPAGDTSTVEEVLERIADSCGAFVGQDRTGLLRTKRLDAPSPNENWTFDDRDILAIEQVSLPYTVPWKAWGIGYQTNWTVQKRIELAAGVSESRRRFLESEQRFVYVQDSAIALAHRTSTGITKPTLFSSRVAAEAESKRLMELYSIGRAMYRVTVKNALFSVEIGQTVRLIYDRWNLGGGQNFVVMGVNDDADAVETELLLFGSGTTADPLPPLTQEIQLHVRFVAPQPSNFDDMMVATRSMMRLAGISVNLRSASTLNAPGYLSVAPGSPQESELYQLGRTGVEAGDIVGYFVQEIPIDFRGFAQINGSNFMLSQLATVWTMAHEIGHNLGLLHVPDTDTDNLMLRFMALITNLPPDLTFSQIITMKKSPLADPFDPGAIVLSSVAGTFRFIGRAPTVGVT